MKRSPLLRRLRPRLAVVLAVRVAFVALYRIAIQLLASAGPKVLVGEPSVAVGVVDGLGLVERARIDRVVSVVVCASSSAERRHGEVVPVRVFVE